MITWEKFELLLKLLGSDFDFDWDWCWMLSKLERGWGTSCINLKVDYYYKFSSYQSKFTSYYVIISNY